MLRNTLFWGVEMGNIRRLVIYTDKISTKKKILIYSDLHLGFKKGNDFREIAKIQELRPENFDCILLPGDIIHHFGVFLDSEKLKSVLKTLKLLTGETPTYYILGNHDQYKRFHFEDWEATNADRFCQELYGLGNFLQLEDGVLYKDGEIELKGLNISASYSLLGHEREQAFLEEYNQVVHEGNFSKQCFSIFMVHDPKSIYRLSKKNGHVLEANTDLVLSGHMHDGLVPRCFQSILKGRGLLSPDYTILPRYAYGVREVGESLFYINGAMNAFIENEFLNRLYGFSCTELTLEPSVKTKKLVYDYN